VVPKKDHEDSRKQRKSKASGIEDRSAAFRNRKRSCRLLGKLCSVLLADMQSRFSMIQVDLDAAQNFVIDDKLIAQLNDRPAFHIEGFLL
jgi:hypothetical protein